MIFICFKCISAPSYVFELKWVPDIPHHFAMFCLNLYHLVKSNAIYIMLTTWCAYLPVNASCLVRSSLAHCERLTMLTEWCLMWSNAKYMKIKPKTWTVCLVNYSLTISQRNSKLLAIWNHRKGFTYVYWTANCLFN